MLSQANNVRVTSVIFIGFPPAGNPDRHRGSFETLAGRAPQDDEFPNAMDNLRHPEERPTGVSRRTQDGAAARVSFGPSADQHSLANDPSVDQGLYRVRRRFQRKAAPDSWLELALSGEFDQRLDVGGGNLRVGFAEPADAHPDRLDPLDQQVIGAGERRRAAAKPEDQDAPAPGEAAQLLLECLAA